MAKDGVVELSEALTFDDVLLEPGFSEVMPVDISLTSTLAREIKLQTPFLSAAMDTVTEAATAITMAQEGGIGIVHRNLTIEEQAREVERVKKFESGMVTDPITASPDETVGGIREIMAEKRISGVPIVEDGKLVGIVTNRDLRYLKNNSDKVTSVMTREVITVTVGADIEKAKILLHEKRIEKLPVLDSKGALVGLITTKDIEKSRRYPLASKDSSGRLLVGAAVGVTPEDHDRVDALAEKGVDVIGLDLAHGNSKRLINFLKDLRKRYKDHVIIAGNVATADAVERLADAGADVVKVGIGPGSICTTRIIAGIGVPQLTAVLNCSAAARKKGITVIADGGIKFSGDIVKALAAGANLVMLGSLFAGTDESPGDTILYQGRTYKSYRGMGSKGAIKRGGFGRYFKPAVDADSTPIPEGIEGRVPYRGSLAATLTQLSGGLRAGMAYVGAKNLSELQKKAHFLRISSASLRESHVHDVIITKEAPNYRPSVD